MFRMFDTCLDHAVIYSTLQLYLGFLIVEGNISVLSQSDLRQWELGLLE